MRVTAFLALMVVGVVAYGGAPGSEPQVVYGTYLGGRSKECATAIAVDREGAAYVAGRTPSRDFPVTAGAFSTKTRVDNNDWTGFVSKLSANGEQLAYSTFVGGDFYSSANAIAVDSRGRAFVVGSTCSRKLETTASAILAKAPGSDKLDVCDGFVVWLNREGSRLEYASYLGGRREDAATAVALSRDGRTVYVGGYTSSADFPVTGTAVQKELSGTTNGFLSAIDVQSGKLIYSTYLGGDGKDYVSRIGLAESGAVYVGGMTDSNEWPSVRMSRFGEGGTKDGFVVRIDPAGELPAVGMRIGGNGEESLAGIDLDSSQDIYVAGTTASDDFPLRGSGLGTIGSGFVAKIDGRRFGESSSVAWSRRIGGHGQDAVLSVSAGMPGHVFVSGRSGSAEFPSTRGAMYRHLEAANDSILAELRAVDGQIEYATFLGGTREINAWYQDEAMGVVAEPSGDVYVTGCTGDDRLPVTAGAVQPQRAGNADAFVLRMRFGNGLDQVGPKLK